MSSSASAALSHAPCGNPEARAPGPRAEFLAVEAALLLTIRDSLLLNILMLLRPIASIKSWQMRP